MYEWLSDALQGPSTVVTANLRLARTLREEFAVQQLKAGKLAWRSAEIYSWQSWLESVLASVINQDALPTRINPHQSQLMWERCLAREIPEPITGLPAMVRLAQDARKRLADWQVSITEVARSADNSDQRLFARAAGRYLHMLEKEHWVDEPGLAALTEQLIRSGQTTCAGRVTFTGFGRERPAVMSIREALVERGCEVRSAPAVERARSVELQAFENTDAEMRAAGAWARERLQQDPLSNVTIIAGNLEREASRTAHLVREGFAPGWQYGPSTVRHSVNVSYGRKLSDFPAVSIALLLLRWLVRDLCASDVGQLLRTPLLRAGTSGSRSRLELRVRRMPDRQWSPSMLSAALRGRDDDDEGAAWLKLVAALTKRRREIPKNASPADWAGYIDETLTACGWPGSETLSSFDFQLLNRWRDLLNDLARLGLVSPVMTLAAAIRRIELMAADTVFQPESETRALQLIGPLEAAGAQFDAIWISGLTANNWPPPGNPSPLLARRLQRRFAMPDAEPADTSAFAQQLLLRLRGAATEVILSYALTEDDTEQVASELLAPLGAAVTESQSDPGWHATTLSGLCCTVVAPDPVPGILPDERVGGGASTIQQQRADPITAFIAGRLGVRGLQPQAAGLPMSLRGSIIHDALHGLYADKPARDEIRRWSDEAVANRIGKSLARAFGRHERNADAVLLELFKLERRRVAELLRRFLKVDAERDDFEIIETEQALGFSQADVRLNLRADRIDRFADGTLAILDYKTGATKKFLRGDGEPQEIQLVAYACAVQEPVSALMLANVDTRMVSFDGAGRGYTDEETWNDALTEWKRLIVTACGDLSRGDVRTNRLQGIQEARGFNLLSRYTELLRDG